MRLASIFFVSASLHAFVWYSVGVSPMFRQAHTEPIEISYVEYVAKIKPAAVPQAPPKVVRSPAKPTAAPVKPTSAAKKVVRYLPPAPSLPLVAVTPVAKTKTSAELIADPQKGKIFVSYFSLVKEKIHQTLRDHYGVSGVESGSVCLYFVLDSSGKLQKGVVVEKDSDAGESLKVLAMQCLHESAPFAAFPKSLAAENIAFNVTVFFGEN